MNKTKERTTKEYSKILLKGGAAVSIAELSTKVIGLLLLPVFTAYLSPEEYGIISLTMLVFTCLNLLYNPGMLSAATRLYHATEVHEERQEIIGSAFRFFVIVPLFVFIVSFFIGETICNFFFANLEFYPYGILAIILALFTQVKRIWSALMTLLYKVHITAIYSVIAAVLSILTSILLVVVFDMGALGRVLGLLPSAIFLYIISLITINKFTNGLWSFSKVKHLLKFGYPLIVAIWSYEILHVADRFIIERMLGVGALGIYSFSYTIGEAQKYLVIGVRQLWSPIFYENMNNKNYVTIKKLISFFIVFITLINCLLILFSKEFVMLFVNERYYESISLISIIVCGLYFNGLLIIFSSSLAFKNKFASISKIAIFSSILNVILNLLFIPYMGIFGCALATLISYFAYFIIGFYIERHTIIEFTDVKLLVYSIVFVVISVLITFLFDENSIVFYQISLKTLFILIYIYSIFIFGFIPKKIIIDFFKTFKGKLKKK